VTLEPCHHTGRTPPCDRKLLEVGAARVVIAFVDPDDRVNGQGIKYGLSFPPSQERSAVDNK
jgi:diaminohydroxyphosphoribosylaminopyrimidine deaminase/5-amino-6-(5-phosphoribosylamino)uracil reductase